MHLNSGRIMLSKMLNKIEFSRNGYQFENKRAVIIMMIWNRHSASCRSVSCCHFPPSSIAVRHFRNSVKQVHIFSSKHPTTHMRMTIETQKIWKRNFSREERRNRAVFPVQCENRRTAIEPNDTHTIRINNKKERKKYIYYCRFIPI